MQSLIVVFLALLVCFGPVTDRANGQSAPLPTEDAETDVRETLLAALSNDEEKALREADTKIKAAEKKLKDLTKRSDILKKNAKKKGLQNPIAASQVSEMLTATKKTLKALQQSRTKEADGFEQKRRQIISRHPLPDDPQLVKRGDRWLTSDEEVTRLKEVKREEQQVSFRQNGQVLADWVWQELANSYDFNAVSLQVQSISKAGVRFVNPKVQQAYSLVPKKTNVVVRPLNRDPRRDDVFIYDIDFTNGLGQVIRKRGYVEVGYDEEGTAYLLGVMSPFLANTLDGQMAACRDSIDNALQRAFGL